MNDSAETFPSLVTAVLTRFYAQTGRPLPAPDVLTEFARRLAALIAERGLPEPLAPAEQGAPGEMSAAEVAPLIARLVEGFTTAEAEALATPARQLVKACFHPEFKVCRDSFREVSADGSCRRQEVARARERVSGSHCVDCPYWTSLNPAQHAKFLAREWRLEPAALTTHAGIFLPEDFRRLRRFLYAADRPE
jgi:hypothetical protein